MTQFENRGILELSLLNEIVKIVNESIDKFGDARLLLSGGSTPKPLYKAFAQCNIDWSKVHIGLVDDRVVSLEDDFSNEKMIREIFYEAKVDLVSIYGLVKRQAQLGDMKNKFDIFFERTDLTLLGMGTDGHTASLFPNDEVSDRLLNSEIKSIEHTVAPQHPKQRITVSKGLIKNSHQIILLIFGEEKKLVYEKAKTDRKPITYFIEECPQMRTFYSPTS